MFFTKKSKPNLSISFCLLLFFYASCTNPQKVTESIGPKNGRILVFSKTEVWKHPSIPYSIEAIQQLGEDNGFIVDTTTNGATFHDENLKKYSAIIFNITTGNVLNPEQQAAFERFIQAGGGYVGIHSAADTEYEWPWYGKLVGAHFASHPHNPNVRKAVIEVHKQDHPATSMLPTKWERTDDWYNFKSFYSGINILASLDENTYGGGTHGANHPIAWYHEFDGGRAFYTSGGHTEESFNEPLFLQHILGGIKYAMGSGIPLNYNRAYSKTTPEENRFVKTTLFEGLKTPMTLAVSDDGRIYYTELRTANLFMYDTKINKNKVVHKFDVETRGGTGLIGVTLDPEFKKNSWIYLYYAPPAKEEPYLFNLSRFTLNNDNTLDLTSEKVLLQVPVQEKSGAHHGGALVWDKDGNLYLSTGDSSSPFPSKGFAPIDERPGKEYYSLDAQRSSANTNDFKGKILRIKPQPDGTYTIPEGNLFPEGLTKTLPEIYIMGTRNPYRIAVNPRTSVLYWGEIGPDAGKDKEQGPKGYDEFNQAKKPGNYGWPYFIANNQAYAEWDFATETAGPKFNPDAPVNNSPNNTGLTYLPPAVPAMIWYPYHASKEFPELGEGGRSAMVGDFYTYNDNLSNSNKFPQYYNGVLFVFDWMRNWVKALIFDENENFLRAESLMSANGDFRRPIDLKFGKDGIMYMLEYGSVYGADNEDSKLVKIEYFRGNRAPIAKAGVLDSAKTAFREKVSQLTSERTEYTYKEIAGKAPLKVLFSSKGTKDLDNDDMVSYEWLFDGKNVGSTLPRPTHTYKKNGVYNAILRVKDKAGLTSNDTVIVKVGNERPRVVFETNENKSFYWEGESFKYNVIVNDKEDQIFPENLKIFFKFNPAPAVKEADNSLVYHDESSLEAELPGAILISRSDCKACHTVDKVSVGPSYTAVAQRYKNKDATDMLAKKIIDGGGGNWGTTYIMSAHPQVPIDEAKEMVNYILSLAESSRKYSKLPAKGTVKFNEHKEEEKNGHYTLLATYTDKGKNGVGPLTGSELITLKNASFKPALADAYHGFTRFRNDLSEGNHKSFIMLKGIDLTNIKEIIFELSSFNKDGFVEVRLHSQEGPAISTANFKATNDWSKFEKVSAKITTPIKGRNDVYFVFLKPDKPNDRLFTLKRIIFEK